MNRQTYFEEIQLRRMLSNCEFARTDKENAPHRLSFLNCKASKQAFLPNYKKESCTFFKEVMFYQKWAEADQFDDFVYNNLDIRGNTDFLTNKQNHIFCTFHLGSYRAINLFLFKHHLDYSLIINQKTIDYNQDDFFKYFETITNRYNLNGSFNIINAEKRAASLSMIKALKRKQNLLFYIDGNTGVGGFARKDEKMVNINFLGKDLLSRKGIAFLSHYLDIPIIPVFSYRLPNQLEPTIEFLDPIVPNNNEEREKYSKNCTQLIWDLFSKFLLKYPEQWEGWLYANHFRPNLSSKSAQIKPLLEKTKSFTFNDSKFDFLLQDNQPHLFDIESANCLKISKSLFRFLKKIKHDHITLDFQELVDLLKKHTLVKDLIQKRVLASVINPTL